MNREEISKRKENISSWGQLLQLEMKWLKTIVVLRFAALALAPVELAAWKSTPYKLAPASSKNDTIKKFPPPHVTQKKRFKKRT